MKRLSYILICISVFCILLNCIKTKKKLNKVRNINSGKIVDNTYINKEKGYKFQIFGDAWEIIRQKILDIWILYPVLEGFIGFGTYKFPENVKFEEINEWFVKGISFKYGLEDIKIIKEEDLKIQKYLKCHSPTFAGAGFAEAGIHKIV